MKIPLIVLAVLSASVLLMPSSVAQDGTVAGCDGHLCNTGSTSIEPLTSRDEAVNLTRCHAACLDIVSFEKLYQIASPTRA